MFCEYWIFYHNFFIPSIITSVIFSIILSVIPGYKPIQNVLFIIVVGIVSTDNMGSCHWVMIINMFIHILDIILRQLICKHLLVILSVIPGYKPIQNVLFIIVSVTLKFPTTLYLEKSPRIVSKQGCLINMFIHILDIILRQLICKHLLVLLN